ncbi:ABC transporter permease [Arsenicicoccus dermatophilus]|uniref:ABC transporter permease n=1 Tax=Arsenicicoccus dermatophilus TaxID=1076331 RepID=UPI001F4CE4E5|nr:ABC transporter permease [Arsenicicoccus dermatophilus]MCH8611519.1 ABC transporter permease [Arsenicicoccus dermatophilus]
MSTITTPGVRDPHGSHPAEPTGDGPVRRESPGNAWQLVAAREIAVKLRDKNFLMGTVVSMLLILGMMGVNAFLAGRTSTTSVAVTSAEGRQLADAVGRAVHAGDDKAQVTVRQVADQATAEREVEDGATDLVLSQAGGTWRLAGKEQPDGKVAAAAREVLQQQALAATAAKAGTTPDALAKAGALQTTALDDGGDERKISGMIVGFVFAFLFYMAALMFGMQIAQSVIEEKQSRIVEILASAIPTRQLLAGKVLGNTVIAVGQIVIYVGLALVGLAFTPYKEMLPALSGSMAWGLVFFLVGFLGLACLWAVAGALATRNEDLQQTATPMTMLLMAGFFATFMAKGIWLKVLSFVPVLSTMLMPGRVASGEAAWWEPVLALLLALAFATATVLLGERMYRRSLMQTSSRMTFRQALAAQD